MAENGAREAALQQWPHLTLRRMMADRDIPPFLSADCGGLLPSDLSRSRSHIPVHSAAAGQPDSAWLAWQYFALCKALTQE